VLPDDLPVGRLVPRVAADGQDFLEQGLLGAVKRGVFSVCTLLWVLGELLGQLPADLAGLLVFEKLVSWPVGNDVILLTGRLAVLPSGQKPLAYQFAVRGIQLLPNARDMLTIRKQKFLTQITIALGVGLPAGGVLPRF
jgi:hypothetical protein